MLAGSFWCAVVLMLNGLLFLWGCSGFLDGVKEAFDGLKLLGVLVGRLFVVAVVFRWPESAFEGLVGWTKI
jgi:hypothetical protein